MLSAHRLFSYSRSYTIAFLSCLTILLITANLNIKAQDACVLSSEMVSDVIEEEVVEVSSQGNWGIASNCTYSTVEAPTAIEIASAASSDLSLERYYEDYKDIDELGDESVWVPSMSRLTVVDKTKNKLVRVGVGLNLSVDQKLSIAVEIAKLALLKL